MSVKTVCEDLFVQIYKHALKEEDPFACAEENFGKIEKIYGNLNVFRQLLTVLRAYGINPPQAESFGEAFKLALEAVLDEFFRRHGEHFQSLTKEELLKTLLPKEPTLTDLPPAVGDAVALIMALDADGIVSDVYATTRLKRLHAELTKKGP